MILEEAVLEEVLDAQADEDAASLVDSSDDEAAGQDADLWLTLGTDAEVPTPDPDALCEVEQPSHDDVPEPQAVPDAVEPIEVELDRVVASPSVSVEASTPSIAVLPPDRSFHGPGLAAAALLVGAVASGVGFWMLTPESETTVSTYVLSAPPSQPLSVVDTTPLDLAISPDGTVVVYATVIDERRQLYRRGIAELEGTVLPDLPSPETMFFSPDGGRIGFADGRSTWHTVSLDGTSPRQLTPQFESSRGATWGPDGSIVLSEERSGLVRVLAPGSEREAITTPDRASGEAGHYWPHLLPGGRALLFTIVHVDGARTTVAVLDLTTREIRRLFPNGHNPQYVDPGYIVYSAAGSVYAVGFDRNRLEVRGYPVEVLSNVVSKSTGTADFHVSRSGDLAYALGTLRGLAPRTLTWVHRDGTEEPIPADPRGYASLRIQPGGQQVSLEVHEPQPAHVVWDLARETLESLMPLVVDASSRGGVTAVATQGGMPIPEGVGTSGDEETIVQATTPTQVGRVSPDGQWLAYASDERGRSDVYVSRVSQPEEQPWQVSLAGGRHPIWAPDGEHLYYLGPDGAMMAVALQTESVVYFEAPVELFRGPYVFESEDRSFDISPDGDRFLVIKHDDVTPQPRFDVIVVEGWVTQLAGRVRRP